MPNCKSEGRHSELRAVGIYWLNNSLCVSEWVQGRPRITWREHFLLIKLRSLCRSIKRWQKMVVSVLINAQGIRDAERSSTYPVMGDGGPWKVAESDDWLSLTQHQELVRWRWKVGIARKRGETFQGEGTAWAGTWERRQHGVWEIYK